MKAGEIIRLFRRKKKMKTDDIAALFGVTTAAVRHWENGYRQISDEHFASIADLLDITIAALHDHHLDTPDDIMQILFDLDRIGVISVDGDLLRINATWAKNAIQLWREKKQQLADGEITLDDYTNWEYSFKVSNNE